MVKLSTMTDHLYSRSSYCFIGLLAAGCEFIGRNKKLVRCLIYMASENRHWIPQKPHKYVSGGLRYLVLYYQSRKVVKGPEAKSDSDLFRNVSHRGYKRTISELEYHHQNSGQLFLRLKYYEAFNLVYGAPQFCFSVT